MTTCILIAAVITCAGTPPRQTPAEAVRVLITSVQPFVPMPPRAPHPLVVIAQSPTFPAPATPIRPLSEPWSVTTYASRGGYVFSTFNGRPFVEPTDGRGRALHGTRP